MVTIDVLQLLLCAFLVLFVFQVFYWNIVRPLVLTKLRYRMFQARDELRMMLVRGELKPTESAFAIVDQICNQRLAALPFITLTSTLFRKTSPQVRLEVEREMEIIKEADPAVRSIYYDTMRVIVGACLLNSPMWLVPMSAAFVLRYWSTEIWSMQKDAQRSMMQEACSLSECHA